MSALKSNQLLSLHLLNYEVIMLPWGLRKINKVKSQTLKKDGSEFYLLQVLYLGCHSETFIFWP